MSTTLTADDVRRALHYDPGSGLFTWKRRSDVGPRWNGRYPGKRAGCLCGGYVLLRLHKRHYRAARIAWLYVHGQWPQGLIDHANCDGTDNRIANLRVATVAQNQCNSRRRANNTSGIKGVTWNKDRSKWQAQICVGYRHIHLGLFVIKQDAAAAYAAAAEQHQGDFRRLT